MIDQIGGQIAPSYEPVPQWGLLPDGTNFGGDATSVAVDSEDNVYVFNRGAMPMIVFNKNGDFINAWGLGEFDRPHGICIDADDNLYLVDTGGHFVQKRTPEGKVLFTIGTPGEPAEIHSGAYFNMPTDVVVHPVSRELFISDGYGNSRVHQFSPEGDHIASFGEPGADDGHFCLPHGIDLLDDDRLVVCDRENFRLQIFTTNGDFLEQWHAHRPAAVRTGSARELLFIAELTYPPRHTLPNCGARVRVLSPDGSQLFVIGAALPGFEPDHLFAPHGLAVDSRGDVYIAEVNYSYVTRDLRQPPPRHEPVSLRKWRRAL